MLAAALVAAGISGCTAIGPSDELPVANTASGCVDDSKACIEKRGTALKGMLGDAKRSWVIRQETAASYATGVKLFAYRQKKTEMSCQELAHGREETRTAPQMLKPGSVSGMNDSRLAQVKDLSGQVSKELAKEFDRVCATPTQARKGFESRAKG